MPRQFFYSIIARTGLDLKQHLIAARAGPIGPLLFNKIIQQYYAYFLFIYTPIIDIWYILYIYSLLLHIPQL